jgi:TM2 domain-containing membrane protein YozV
LNPKSKNDKTYMKIVYLIGIFVSVASALVGIISFYAEQKRKGTRRKNILLATGFIFIISLIITAVNYFQEKQGEEKHKTGLYVTNGSERRRIYFHNAPDPSTRRDAFINSKAEVLVKKIENGFGYVEFKNTQGAPSYGWLEMEKLILKP